MSQSATVSAAKKPPASQGGWSEEMRVIAKARLIPPEDSGLVQACGVLDAEGAFVRHSATWRGKRQTITPPEAKAATAKLPGRHLYAGQFWSHFGHFMVESLPRLWALDHLREPVDSILFIPKRPNRAQELQSYQKAFFELLQIDLPITLVAEPTEVEELVVPGQGFGLGEIAHGTDRFRAFIANRFARDVEAEGPEHLYLSRSALAGREGTALHEEAIETSLARDGYETYHPQEHSIAAQVARYRAAKRVVGLDGSAFHLFGFVGQPEQRAGLILRRNTRVFRAITKQLRGFCQIEPQVFSAIAADWVPEHKSRPGRYSYGELDFPVLARMMHEHGFAPPYEQWDIPGYAGMQRAIKRISRKKGVAFSRVVNPDRLAAKQRKEATG